MNNAIKNLRNVYTRAGAAADFQFAELDAALEPLASMPKEQLRAAARAVDVFTGTRESKAAILRDMRSSVANRRGNYGRTCYGSEVA